MLRYLEIIPDPISSITVKITMIAAEVPMRTAMPSPAMRITVGVALIVPTVVVEIALTVPTVAAEIALIVPTVVAEIALLIMVSLMPIAGCGNRRKQQESCQWKSSKDSQRS